jgi:transcriptional regulator with XRE-family HTH domain
MKRTPAKRPALRQVLGLNIRVYRARRGYSQRELAERAGSLPSRIVSIENGRGSTTVDLIEKLAEALDVAPARLLTPDEE